MKKTLKAIAMVMAMLFGMMCLAGCQKAPVEAPVQEPPVVKDPVTESLTGENQVEATPEPDPTVVQLTPVETGVETPTPAGTYDEMREDAAKKLKVLQAEWIDTLNFNKTEGYEIPEMSYIRASSKNDWEVNPSVPDFMYEIPYNIGCLCPKQAPDYFRTNKELLKVLPADILAEVLQRAVDGARAYAGVMDYRDPELWSRVWKKVLPECDMYRQIKKIMDSCMENQQGVSECYAITDKSLVYINNAGQFCVRVACFIRILNDSRSDEELWKYSHMKKNEWALSYYELVVDTVDVVAEAYETSVWDDEMNYSVYTLVDLTPLPITMGEKETDLLDETIAKSNDYTAIDIA